MAWCENHAVDYVLGWRATRGCDARSPVRCAKAKREQQRTGNAARVFREFFYRTRSSWSRSRRVVAKASILAKGENPASW